MSNNHHGRNNPTVGGSDSRKMSASFGQQALGGLSGLSERVVSFNNFHHPSGSVSSPQNVPVT